MKTVLVTGSEGFIGQQLCKRLAARRILVHRLDFAKENTKINFGEGRFIQHDLASGTIPCLPSGIDTVIHLAGKAHALSEVRQDVDDYWRLNTIGTQFLLKSFNKTRLNSFVFFSTVKAMGEREGCGMYDENNETLPNTPYGISKREAERFVLEARNINSPVVIRPSLVYGDKPKGNLEKMIRAVIRRRFPPISENGNRRSMVHIDDLLDAVVRVASDSKVARQTYIVADNMPFSTRQLFDWIRDAAGMRPCQYSIPTVVLEIAAKIGDLIGLLRQRRFVFDTDALRKLLGSECYSSGKLQREIGWKPLRNMREALPGIIRSMQLR